ncbi:MAG: OmpA family protein [Bacteroidota bacterium]
MKRSLLLILLLMTGWLLFGQTRIHSVYFGGGSYYVNGQQVADIETFLKSIPNLEHHQITVSSHTDNIGGKEYNAWLSGMRSQTVTQILERIDLPLNEVSVIDNGQLNPLFDNRTMDGRLANRRVDIILEPIVL